MHLITYLPSQNNSVINGFYDEDVRLRKCIQQWATNVVTITVKSSGSLALTNEVTPGLTWIRLAGKPPQYATSHPCQLSHLPSMGM